MVFATTMIKMGMIYKLHVKYRDFSFSSKAAAPFASLSPEISRTIYVSLTGITGT